MHQINAHMRRMATQRARKGSAGMTLIELMIAAGLLAVVITMFLNAQFSSMLSNRQVRERASGTFILRRQMEELQSAAFANRSQGHGVAKGLVFILQEISKKVLASGSDSPVSVELDGNEIVYSFLVPEPGWRPLAPDGADSAVPEPYRNARGRIRVLLDENTAAFPEFESVRTWGDIRADNLVDDDSATFFDMNNNQRAGDNFTYLFTASDAVYAQSDLTRVIVIGEIDYYANEADRDRGIPWHTLRRSMVVANATRAF